ncbi:sodium/glutamate symporter, partial [Klebsiella pneumoniae]|uniref:sodium/glutamate symporter n=1 Tax=Klebsiella pneumoniae TaxID=573 RepID=UPI003B9802F4
NVSLSLFLAIALMSFKLWDLAALALPFFALLAAQTPVMALFAIFVTFRVMGRNYDAAVLAAGHCGFGLGATPTAIANMQAVTQRYGAS